MGEYLGESADRFGGEEREREVLLRRRTEAAAEGESLTQRFSNRNVLLGVAFVMLVVAFVWVTLTTSQPTVT